MSRDKSKVLNLAPRRPGQRPPVDEAAMRALEERLEARGNGVAGQAAPETDVEPERHEPTSSRARKLATPGGAGTRDNPRVRRDGAAMRSTTVHLPVELARQLAVYCATEGRRHSDVMAEALAAYLRRKG